MAAEDVDLAEFVNKLSDALDGMTTKVQQSGTSLDGATTKVQQSGTSLADVMSTVASGLTSAVSGFATSLSAPLSLIQGLVGPVSQFVAALNPQLMEAFGSAIQGLMATIGVAFEPLIQALIPVIQQIAGALLPAAQALAPVIAQLAQIFAAVLVPVIRIVSVIFQALAPVLKIIATLIQIVVEALQPLFTVIQILAVVLKTFFDFIGKLILGPLGKLLESLAGVMNTVIKYMILFAAAIAKALGFGDFVKDLIDSFDNKPGAKPGAKDFSISGFEQILRDVTLAAAQAAAGGADQEDPMRDILDELRKIDAGEGTLGKISKTVNDILEFIKSFKETVQQSGVGLGARVGGWLRRNRGRGLAAFDDDF